MRKIWLVTKREYLTRVRTKAFIISTFALPLFTIAIFVIPLMLASKQAERTLQIAILDGSASLGTAVGRAMDQKLANGQREFQLVQTVTPTDEGSARQWRTELSKRVREDRLDGYLVLASNVLEGG